MAKERNSLHHLLFLLFIELTTSADERQACIESDQSTGEALELLQVTGRKQIKHAMPELPEQQLARDALQQYERMKANQSRTGLVISPDRQALAEPLTPKTCNHKLSGVDDVALLAALTHTESISGTEPVISSQLYALQQRGIFIVAILHNCSEIIPRWTSELIRLLLALKGTEHSGNLFVSVYESGSTDRTAELLHTVEQHLNFIGIPNNITTAGATREHRQRIEYLADLRNKAMEPLRASQESFDHVLWLSDSLFCADSVLQMLAHQLPESQGGISADAVCGMDYGFGNLEEKGERCVFYDTWASHDITGNNFANDKPFVRNMEDAKDGWISPGPGNEQLEAGEPFQVFSCWNAVAAFSADIFQKLAFRIPRVQLKECATAETELLFRDMWRIGRGKIVISPTAASAYSELDFQQCVADKQPAEFARVAPIAWRPAPQSVQCCPLLPYQDMVDFRNCFTETRTGRLW